MKKPLHPCQKQSAPRNSWAKAEQLVRQLKNHAPWGWEKLQSLASADNPSEYDFRRDFWKVLGNQDPNTLSLLLKKILNVTHRNHEWDGNMAVFLYSFVANYSANETSLSILLSHFPTQAPTIIMREASRYHAVYSNFFELLLKTPIEPEVFFPTAEDVLTCLKPSTSWDKQKLLSLCQKIPQEHFFEVMVDSLKNQRLLMLNTLFEASTLVQQHIFYEYFKTQENFVDMLEQDFNRMLFPNIVVFHEKQELLAAVSDASTAEKKRVIKKI